MIGVRHGALVPHQEKWFPNEKIIRLHQSSEPHGLVRQGYVDGPVDGLIPLKADFSECSPGDEACPDEPVLFVESRQNRRQVQCFIHRFARSWDLNALQSLHLRQLATAASPSLSPLPGSPLRAADPAAHAPP